MGRVFTPQELVLGWVPNQQSFDEAIERINSFVKSRTEIRSACLLGSASIETLSPRSDIDLLVSFSRADEEIVGEALADLVRACHHLFVPAQVVPVVEEEASAGIHSIGPSFAEHIKRTMNSCGVLKGNPLEKVVHTSSPRQDVLAYLQAKKEKIFRATIRHHVFSEEEAVKQAARILNVAVNVARKMLFLRFKNARYDTKHEVVRGYRAYFRDCQNIFETLINADHRYSSFVSDYIAWRHTRGFGEDAQKHIEDALELAPTAIEFIRMNLVSLDSCMS